MATRPRRPGFSRRQQTGLFVSYVLVVSGAMVAALILAISIFDPQTFASVRMAAAEVTTPISSAGAWVTRSFSQIGSGIGDYFLVKQRNAALRQQIDDEKRLVMRARSLSYENRRLKALLQVRERISEPVIAARIVSSTASSTRRFAMINAGYRQGVLGGQPVRGPDGLIGRVVEAGPDAARVLLITDPESIVPVRRARDGLPALAAGRGDGLLEIRSIANSNVAFGRGDVFITSGTGGIYPPNIPVALVSKAGRDSVIARSFALPDTLDYAIVQRSFMRLPAERGATR